MKVLHFRRKVFFVGKDAWLSTNHYDVVARCMTFDSKLNAQENVLSIGHEVLELLV